MLPAPTSDINWFRHPSAAAADVSQQDICGRVESRQTSLIDKGSRGLAKITVVFYPDQLDTSTILNTQCPHDDLPDVFSSHLLSQIASYIYHRSIQLPWWEDVSVGRVTAGSYVTKT